MPKINIAAATALEVLNPRGRELGILAGANVVMPNVTPSEERVKYNLYNRKTLDLDLKLGPEIPVGYGEWGDSKAFTK